MCSSRKPVSHLKSYSHPYYQPCFGLYVYNLKCIMRSFMRQYGICTFLLLVFAGIQKAWLSKHVSNLFCISTLGQDTCFFYTLQLDEELWNAFYPRR